ncbi:hypothetical protein PMZ80_003139 [Knufia obscura]|uniref:RRN7-type domain-containing protein n=2 Tax=Knufia TaxID=430999 RepID=A0AAN8EL98_9EURO|nr:hypothetical protein PMZ80_003139 [Knufia obscura]KAK5949321.1 hypothetical protein OHC33_009674 [Knufia fluminis]
MSQRSPCPYCGNATFEEENGILVCTSCGRQQEGGLQVADDDADFGTQGKVTRKKIEKTKVKVSKVYHGPRGYRLYLLAWQHVLWRQCYALMNGSVKAPDELWHVVKDLWALKLSRLVHRLEDTGGRSTDAETDYATESRTSETEDEAVTDSTKAGSLRPKLWDSIGLVYLGILLLRQPMSLSQLYHLIRTEEVPFIRAFRSVPTDISSKLPSEYQLALDTTTIPSQYELQQAVYKLLQDYCVSFGITIPSLNWKALLFDWTQELGLPLEIYSAVKKLAALIEFDFTYQLSHHSDLEGGTTRKKRRSPVAMPDAQLISLIVVATKLLYPFDFHIEGRAQPFGSSASLRIDWSTWLTIQKSHVASNTSATSQTMQPDRAIETSAPDIHDFNPEALDQYMDWYQATFTTPEPVLKAKKTDLENSILNMFPLSDLPAASTQEGSQARENDSAETGTLVSQIQREAILPATATAVPRPDSPGSDSDSDNNDEHANYRSSYLIFPKPEILQATDIFFGNDTSKNHVTYFHERAAALACLDVKRLLRAVRYTEKKLEAWHYQQRRTAAFTPADVEGADSGVGVEE